MKITFLGATHEVTGSCTLVEVGGVKFIVDCGIEQGRDIFENQELPVNSDKVDFVLLTHAHIDHSGNLPLLYKKGFRGKVYATEATCRLCDIMLRDSAHIQMAEAEYKSRKQKRSGGTEIKPIYNLEDVEGVLKKMSPCKYGESIHPAEGVAVRFTDAGHLLGSSSIELWLNEGGAQKKVVFSGDVGNIGQPLVRDPEYVESADYVVVESTYGDRTHGVERPDYAVLLAGIIQRALDRGGNVIIPSFAIGRTQEMLYFIHEIKEKGLVRRHDGFKVFVDSPLAIEATKVFLDCDTDFLEEDVAAIIQAGVNPLEFDGLEVAVSTDESKAINMDKEPKIIISASGMCDAGRIRHHLKYNLWRPECVVLFVGYQAEGSLGRILQDGVEKVKLFGDEIAVKAEITSLPGISGHADKNGLIAWLGGFREKPAMVFVNHGDDESCTQFTRSLSEERGYKVFSPYSGTSYDLVSEKFTEMTEGIPIIRKESEVRGKKLAGEVFKKLIAAAERMLRAVRKCEGKPNRELNEYVRQIENITHEMEK